MKNTFKSALAAITFGLALVACTPKDKPADTTADSIVVAPDTTATVPADTTVVDSVAAQ